MDYFDYQGTQTSDKTQRICKSKNRNRNPVPRKWRFTTLSTNLLQFNWCVIPNMEGPTGCYFI